MPRASNDVELRADVSTDVPDARELFREYADGIGVDLSFQGFEQELAALPGRYAPPQGTLILARRGDEACGCVALRSIDERTCEMKRLYVRPACRGLGIGAALVGRLIEAAETLGYRAMRLDTLASMTRAVALYRSFGFVDIDPYIFNPLPGARFMERALEPRSARPPRL